MRLSSFPAFKLFSQLLFLNLLFPRLQTRQWSDRVIRKEVRQWKVRGGTMSKEVQVRLVFSQF